MGARVGQGGRGSAQRVDVAGGGAAAGGQAGGHIGELRGGVDGDAGDVVADVAVVPAAG